MKPPANMRTQRSMLKSQKLLTNGIGTAHRKHSRANEQVTYKVLGDSNPPSDVVTLPPTITPATGPVILTTPKAIFA